MTHLFDKQFSISLRYHSSIKQILDAFLNKFIGEIAYLSFQTFYPNFMYRKSMNITITSIKDLY